MLAGLPQDIKQQVRARARIIRVPRGSVLFEQGDPARHVYLCRSGQLKLFRLSPSGQEKTIAIIGPGRSFAEATMFMPKRRYPVRCDALRSSELLVVDADHLVGVLRSDPDACFSLLGTLAVRLQEKIGQIDWLSVQNANLRVAQYLLEEFRRLGEPDSFSLELSKKHIAGLLAIQPETFSRSLGEFRKAGILAVEARRIRVLAPERLRRVARGEEPLYRDD